MSLPRLVERILNGKITVLKSYGTYSEVPRLILEFNDELILRKGDRIVFETEMDKPNVYLVRKEQDGEER